MSLPQLTIHRHDRCNRALITLAGEIDLESAPLLRAALAQCLSDGIRIVDVDLTGSGLLLLGPPIGHLPPPLRDGPAPAVQTPPPRRTPLVAAGPGGAR